MIKNFKLGLVPSKPTAVIVTDVDNLDSDAGWTFTDPLGDCSYAVVAGTFQISADTLNTHSYDGAITSPSLGKTIPATWKEITVKVDSELSDSVGYGRQGIGLYLDTNNFIRFDSVGVSGVWTTVKQYVGGVGTTFHNGNLVYTKPYYLRFTKVGSEIEMSYSDAGSSFIVLGMTIGIPVLDTLHLHAGNNAGNTHVAIFDSVTIDYVA